MTSPRALAEGWLFILQQNVSQDRELLLAAMAAEHLPYRVLRLGRRTLRRPSFNIASAIPLGSVAFVVKAHQAGWGGVWRDPAMFDFAAYEAGWGDRMLNAGAVRCSLAMIQPFDGFRFIRPLADSKAFNGAVVEGVELTAWRAHTTDYNGTETTGDTPVLVAEAQTLLREWRCFIVSGDVVAATQYYRRTRLVMETGAPASVVAYAKQCASAWQPAPAFVLDVGELTDGTLRIIEAGCINCAGFYKADPRPVLRALSQLAQP